MVVLTGHRRSQTQTLKNPKHTTDLNKNCNQNLKRHAPVLHAESHSTETKFGRGMHAPKSPSALRRVNGEPRTKPTRVGLRTNLSSSSYKQRVSKLRCVKNVVLGPTLPFNHHLNSARMQQPLRREMGLRYAQTRHGIVELGREPRLLHAAGIPA